MKAIDKKKDIAKKIKKDQMSQSLPRNPVYGDVRKREERNRRLGITG